MGSNSTRAKFLCPNCEYGCFFRTVKSAEGIPYDIEYTCGPLEGPHGPGGWDGKTCPNFVEGKKKDPLEGCKITTTEGREPLVVDVSATPYSDC
jgi:hypothetical protein